MVYVGLRKDFLAHREKTLEAFKLVKSDITSINGSIGHLKDMAFVLESRISKLDNAVSGLKASLDKCSSDINLQQINNKNIASKIESINSSMKGVANKINSIQHQFSKSISKNQRISSIAVSNRNLIKKLSPQAKLQSLKIRRLNSDSRKFREDIKKLKNFIGRKLRTAKRRDEELEATIKKQRRRILALNRRIEAKKAAGKTARKAKPRKIIKKTITPKKTVTETITPKTRTVKEVKK